MALEGLDGVGKTTAAKGLERALKRLGLPVVVRHSERQYLRSAFRFVRERNDPKLKYLLQACAATLMNAEIACAPAHTIFICDRYFVSARAYYLALCGEPDPVNPESPLLPEPDVAVMLQCVPGIRRQRLRGMRNKPSARKLRATRRRFSMRMMEIMMPTYKWINIDTSRTSKEETVLRVFDLVMEAIQSGQMEGYRQ